MTISHAAHDLLAIAASHCWPGCTYFRREDADQGESTLAAAGFQMKPADTPKRRPRWRVSGAQARLARARRSGDLLLRRPRLLQVPVLRQPAAVRRYRQLAIQQQIAQEQVDAAEMNENAAMDWGMWGPFW